MRDGAHLPGEPDLPDADRTVGERPVVDTARERGRHGEDTCRLLEPDPADDVEEDVERGEGEAGALVEHREQEREAAAVVSGAHALRRAEPCLRGEPLHLQQHRPGPLDEAGDGAPTRPNSVAIPEEERTRVIDRHESLRGHPEDAELVDGAEAVFGRAEHPVVPRALALEVEHRVHDVLEGLRAGDATALGDMSDDEHRRARLFREPHQTGGTLSHLPDIPRRALEVPGEDGLDGVDDEDGGRRLRRRRQDRLEIRLAEERYAPRVHLEPIRPQLHLERRFLAAHVERAMPGALEQCRNLEQDRALPDSRLAADQDHGTGDDAASEHEVELTEAGTKPLGFLAADIAEP
ncbi:MAG: hypothetical protein RI891_470, partial [Gemmatimonadota bacterium]